MHGILELLMLLRVRMWSHSTHSCEQMFLLGYYFLQAFHGGDRAWLQTYGNLLPRSRVDESPENSNNQNQPDEELPPTHMLLAFQVDTISVNQLPVSAICC